MAYLLAQRLLSKRGFPNGAARIYNDISNVIAPICDNYIINIQQGSKKENEVFDTKHGLFIKQTRSDYQKYRYKIKVCAENKETKKRRRNHGDKILKSCLTKIYFRNYNKQNREALN